MVTFLVGRSEYSIRFANLAFTDWAGVSNVFINNIVFCKFIILYKARYYNEVSKSSVLKYVYLYCTFYNIFINNKEFATFKKLNCVFLSLCATYPWLQLFSQTSPDSWMNLMECALVRFIKALCFINITPFCLFTALNALYYQIQINGEYTF